MIKILDKNVVDKIAAGEVVDRPVSIIKELFENSIDAGSDSIVVEIKKGGKTYIRVSDNGSGISSDEAELAFTRHATSKITEAEDLDSIETLGFRGEALASIAAVSRVELITKTSEERIGLRMCAEGGEIMEKSGTGCPDGTTIVVRDLFYNIPARLKFLKTDSAESGLIIDFVTNMALAYPDLRVRMVNNDHILFATRGKGSRIDAITTLTSREFAKKLLPVSAEMDGMKIEGYVSGPGESRPSRRGQIYFVNGRTVSSKPMERGVSAAYSDRLFEGRHPVVYLFLTIGPDQVDVNVHPNKKEVKFHDDRAVQDLVETAIKEALTAKEAVPELKTKNEMFKKKEHCEKHEIHQNNIINKKAEKYKEASCQEKIDVKSILSTYREEDKIVAEEAEDLRSDIVSEHAEKFDFRELDYRGVVFGTYIMATDDDYLYLLDQHAAHERVYYEKLRKQFLSAEKYKQEIMVPITVNADFSDNDWIGPLEDMGFSIEEFGPNTYAVRAIPSFFDLSEGECFVKDFIDSVNSGTDFKSRELMLRIASKACKSAVKAHDTLKKEEIDQLVSDLAECENPYSCPHGRPTFIRISKNDIERRFKRK